MSIYQLLHPNNLTLYANIIGTVVDFTGTLVGDIQGTMKNTQISPGVIVNNDISALAAIADIKFGTIITAGKVANSATTATCLNTDNTIVLHNMATGVSLPGLDVNGNIFLSGGSNYCNISMSGGNAVGYIYANFPAVGDGIYLSYNCYYLSGSTVPFIPVSTIATSIIGIKNGSFISALALLIWHP